MKGTCSPRGPRSHDGTIIPDTVDTMWGTDLTTTITGEGAAAVFIAVDHCAAECVGIHAHPHARPASKPWSRSARACGSTSADSPRRSPAVSLFGMIMDRNACPTTSRRRSRSSASRVHPPSFAHRKAMAVPSGSSGRSRRTCCGCTASRRSRSLRHALLAFRETYNTTWLIERHGFIAPADFRKKQLQSGAIAA